jgi:hypothetical protein
MTRRRALLLIRINAQAIARLPANGAISSLGRNRIVNYGELTAVHAATPV